MLRWRELYPYSAVHVVRVSRPLDALQLESGISRALESFGLTGLVLDSGARRYTWRGGDAAVRLNVLAGGLDPSAARDAEIERQLNIAFDADGRIDPFRFFAIDAGTSFHLGIAYDHFVAAGDAIVRLLKNIVDGAGDAGPAAARLNPYAPSYAHLF